MKSAIKALVMLQVIPDSRYLRQSAFATNRTQQRLRPTSRTVRKSNQEKSMRSNNSQH